MTLKRFGVSVPEDLLNEFDKIVEKRGYIGRSEAIRDAMRLYISEAEWESEQEGKAATLTVVYKHTPSLMTGLVKAQHVADAEVIASTHVHLTHSYCLEVMAIRGTREAIERLASTISGMSGVTYSRLFAFSLPDEDENDHHH
ncbi:MAG: nickel-responsive transcriptional regulator NikR [Candidatus Thorarchaeota archaeon]